MDDDFNSYEMMPMDKMLARVQKYHPGDSYQLVEKAYKFAEKAHSNYKRKSGEPYFIHPCFVASILCELMMDAQTIAAGLLHDTVEDCKQEGVTLEIIEKEFGDEVARLVDGVTKLDRLDFTDREEQQAESLRKMIIAMSKDIRVVIIKLADRLHNMRTLKFQSPERQVAIAHETLEIYAPLAHRLGVFRIKQELEDLSLQYIDPQGYQDIVQKVGMRRAERQENIRAVIKELSEKLEEAGLHYQIDGRPKHYYSIYKKMVLQNKPFEQIYDLIAIRVIVDTIPDCYTVLGIVHTLWKQVPNRFKDYISMPKANMYQSLHTTVIGGRAMPVPFEVQIRTWEMHRVAEYGIAAHWRYKEGRQASDDLDSKLYWLRQIIDWQSETKDSKEFIDSLKVDLFSEDVFVFTPKGDIVSMQRGATPLDFAYRIHSAVGNSCVGAKVNGKIVPLDTPLNTGDRVDIITSSSSRGPSMDWLKVVKTQQAKAKIRQYFRKELHGENVDKGKDMLDRECKRRGLQLGLIMKPEFVAPILQKYGFTDIEDIFGAVGYGAMASTYVVTRLLDEQRALTEAETPKTPPVLPTVEEAQKKHDGKATHGIFVEGGSGMLLRFARCCNPVPGDEIVGYITRGRGVTVHKADCVNAINSEPERKVTVSWDTENKDNYNATIQIIAYDHVGLLGELATYLSDMNVPINAVTAKVAPKNKTTNLSLVVQTQGVEQLDKIIRQLQKRSDVIEVFRGA
ncbi:MAG: bifunctional (p)ppGpp synthetase/guanosine-3',5'-bis(diphosphate) 3'-pyrophosphohydrolase [Eubacteriales bacterium]|nr:bifunctional (p)ppGpp synthetase/guanosine-3',5'-bis(diphosphate) 3'-pyrophosphohydrolase [Eubacteriales bacterium]MDD3882424.1 bifunctional (p)ppGpp synthetase/guanosine-3',5'-bis(diphosphate) 3'-pyrophosphohydrolase [Eubacteriales bacterium]